MIRILIFLGFLLVSVGTQSQSSRKALKMANAALSTQDTAQMMKLLPAESSVQKWQADYNALQSAGLLYTRQLSRAEEMASRVNPEQFKWMNSSSWSQILQEIEQKKRVITEIETDFAAGLSHDVNSYKGWKQQLIKIDTTHYLYAFCEGFGYKNDVRFQQAFTWFQKAEQRATLTNSLYFKLGAAYYELGELKESIRLLDSVDVTFTPQDTLLYLQTEAYTRLRNYSIALQKAEQYSDSTFWKMYRLGDLYRANGMQEKSLKSFQAAAELQPKNQEVWLRILEQLSTLQRNQEVDQLLSDLLVKFPKQNAFVQFSIEWMLKNEKSGSYLTEQIKQLQEETGYTSLVAYYTVKAAILQKDFELADQHFRQLSKQDQEYFIALEVVILIGLDKHQEAFQVLDAAIAKGTVFNDVYAYHAALCKYQGIDFKPSEKKARHYGWKGELPVIN